MYQRWLDRQHDGFRITLNEGKDIVPFYSFKGKLGWPFCPSTHYFINDLCGSHASYENQGFDGAEITVRDPQQDCLVLLFMTEKIASGGVTRYEACLFDGKVWTQLPKPDFIQIGKGSISAWVDSMEFTTREPYHFPAKYLLDFWLGKISISDLFAIQNGIFLRRQIGEALELTRKLKDAVRSNTAREIESLLEKAAGRL